MDKDWQTRIHASRSRLLAIAAQGPATVATLEAPPPPRPDGDEGDIAQVVIDGEIAQRIADLRSSLQEQLSRALDQLALGRYGYCEDCGSEIPAERMEFAPETTTCVPCQGRRDRARG